MDEIYLETSLFGYYHETRISGGMPIEKNRVLKIFELIARGVIVPYTSVITVNELSKITNEIHKKRNLILLIPTK